MADSTLPSLSGNAALDRARRRLAQDTEDFLDPSATVTFTQAANTGTTNTVAAALPTTLTTAATSGELILATTKMQDAINTQGRLINQLIDILQANELALTT